MLFLEKVLHVDMQARPTGLLERLVMVASIAPMILLMMLAIFVAGYPVDVLDVPLAGVA